MPFISNAEHIMVMPALGKRHWTAADVRALIDENRHWPRYELLDGELLASPADIELVPESIIQPDRIPYLHPRISA